MRLVHQTVSFDHGIIQLLLERVNSSGVAYRVLSLLGFLIQVRLIQNLVRLIESILGLLIFFPVPVISSIIVRYIKRLPGALGYYLRALYFRQRAKFVGRNVLVGENVTVKDFRSLSLGDFAYLDRDVIIMSKATIGKGCHIAVGCFVSGGGELVVEDFASLGMRSVILTASDSPTRGYRGSGPTVPLVERNVVTAKTVFKRDAFTGPLTLVFPGAVMNEGSVLSAGSVLRRTTKEWGVYLGNPAKRVSWRRPVAF